MGSLAGERRREERLGLAALLAGMALLHVGIGNAYVPLEDEGSHVLAGIAVSQGQPSTNPYYHLYALVFRHLTSDPITAHLLLRTVASLTSAVALYFVLTGFPRIRPAASAIACLAWGASKLCTPTLQSGTSGVLALTLVLLPLGLVLRRPGWASLSLFVLAAFWASQIRPEYYAPLVAVPVVGALYARRRRGAEGDGGAPGGRSIRAAGAVAAVAVLLSALGAARTPRPKALGFDAYLLLGLGQCYASYYRERHPDEIFDPMTEYQPLLDRVFDHPKTFRAALAHNPGEAARYFVVNGLENLVKLPRAVLSNKNRFLSALVLLLVGAGSALGVAGWWRARSAGRSTPALSDGNEPWRLGLLVALLSASSCAIPLLIPAARYWLSWAPLLYLWVAWSVENLLAASRSRSVEKLALLGAAAAFGFPIFPRLHSNRGTVLAVRAAGEGMGRKPVLAGNFVLPLSAFAFGDQAVPVNAYNGLSFDELRAGRYDFLQFDLLDHTAIAHRNQELLARFEATPEEFGYRLLAGTADQPPIVYAKLR